MNLNELTAVVSGKAGISKANAKLAINATFEAIKNEVKAGNSIRISDFGTFSKGHRAARKGINPLTKKEIDIAAKDTLKVKASSNFF